MIILLEGLDGAGKTTHTKLLAERLKASIQPEPHVGTIKFPNKETETGKLIYSHLDEKWAATSWGGGSIPRIDRVVFQSLQLTNRMEAAGQVDRYSAANHRYPAKHNRRFFLIMDRYWPSAYAYGVADGLDAGWIMNCNRALPQPDVFILIDIDPKDSVERRPGNRDRYEADPEFMSRVAQNYRDLWGSFRHYHYPLWNAVNGRQSKELVAEAIWGALSTWLKQK